MVGMETAMIVRSFVAAVLALALSSGSHAEPAKPAVPTASDRPAAPILMASANIEGASVGTSDSGTSDGASAPKRKRAARVTTCRCGGQTAPSED